MADDRTKGTGWRYRLHGFTLESDLELAALVRDEDHGRAADVTLCIGAVPDRLEAPRERGACYAAGRGDMLFWLPGVARILVRGGGEIAVEPAGDSARERLPALVLSSPLAALLMQRGLLPLHASAVATPEGAVVLVGSAAIGKSTLAAAMERRGLMPLSDDVTALQVDDDVSPMVIPGYPLLRLWPDAVAALGLDPGVPERPPGAKRLLSFRGDFPAAALPIAAICVLDRGVIPAGGKLSRRLEGREAVSAMLDAVYRPAFARGLGLERRVFAQVTTVVKRTRVMSLLLPADRFEPFDLARRVIEELWS